MLPRPVGNLICCGRCISVDRDMLGTLRVMSPSMAMGQAAGQAARQVVKDGASFAGIDMKKLLQELAGNGVRLAPPKEKVKVKA